MAAADSGESEEREDHSQLLALVAAAFDPDPAASFGAAHRLRLLATDLERRRLRAARAAGVPWNEIGSAVGMSDRQAWDAFRALTESRRPRRSSRRG